MMSQPGTITHGRCSPTRGPQITREPNRAASWNASDQCVSHTFINEEKSARFQERDTKIAPIVRDAIFEIFPEVLDDTDCGRFALRFLNHLLSPAKHDENTGGNIIPCELIAQFAGVEWTPHFCAKEYLKEFEARFSDRMGITITGWNYREGIARTMIVDWPTSICKAFSKHDFLMMSEDDIDKTRKKERVYFMSGERVSRRKLKEEKMALIAERANVCATVPPEAMQKPLLNLVNEHLTKRSSTIHNAVMEGVPKLLRWLSDYLQSPYRTHRHGKEIAPEGQRYYREWLPSLIEPLTQPFPDGCYVPSDKSVRLHASGLILHYFPRDGRKALLGHLTTLDLKSSQLAIAAKLWGAERTLVQLEKRECIWGHFLGELDLDAGFKPALKTTLYSLCFGMSKRRLQSELVWNLRDQGFNQKTALDTAKKFLALEIMQDLLQARERQIQRIRDTGGVCLPDWEWQGEKHKGEWVALDEVPKSWLDQEAEDEGTLGCYEHNVRSLLAQRMQAAEMGIMLAAAEVIAATPDITIVSFLHDGLTLAFRDESLRVRQTKAVQKAVRQRCEQNGFLTYL